VGDQLKWHTGFNMWAPDYRSNGWQKPVDTRSNPLHSQYVARGYTTEEMTMNVVESALSLVAGIGGLSVLCALI